MIKRGIYRSFGILCLVLGVLANAQPLQASEGKNIDSVAFQEQIKRHNRIKPLQNPRYEQSKDILKRNVLDNKNKAIGEVQDIAFDTSGQVFSLKVNFDRLNLRRSVYLNRNTLDIGSVSAGYRLGFNEEEVESLYPVLLASIETASGENGEDILNLSDLLGITLIDSNGQIIGDLQDVLFDKNGAYVRSIYVNINYRGIYNKGVALPLSVLSFEEKNGKSYAVIDEAYVDSILEMAEKS
ncbi:MAG: PRC-barrel domain-containing protein [Alphaproteobacteria bacterium]